MARIDFDREGADVLTLRVSGDWRLGEGTPETTDLGAQLHDVPRARIDGSGLGDWDSSLLSLLLRFAKACHASRVELDTAALPTGVQRLLKLATAVPEAETQRHEAAPPFVERVGTITIAMAQDALSIVTFFGESILVFGRWLRGKARYRRTDLTLTIQQVGAEALPIVSVINFLLGMILAFVGGLQLQKFGASIFVADVVGVGMTREMAPLMTAIIMSGRTGAAYAAQLGTMTVNEEIDALRTFGIPPMDFLVLPRMLALILMMPLLCAYAMAIGIMAGGLSAWAMLGISPAEYMEQTKTAVDLTQITIGLVKGSIFGALVAISGCLRGMQSGRNAAAVGKAATSAVVTGILLIILMDTIINMLTQFLGI